MATHSFSPFSSTLRKSLYYIPFAPLVNLLIHHANPKILMFLVESSQACEHYTDSFINNFTDLCISSRTDSLTFLLCPGNVYSSCLWMNGMKQTQNFPAGSYVKYLDGALLQIQLILHALIVL